jgi:hypothetical protein
MRGRKKEGKEKGRVKTEKKKEKRKWHTVDIRF